MREESEMDEERKPLPWWKDWTDERAAWWTRALVWLVVGVGGVLVLYTIYRALSAMWGVVQGVINSTS